MKTTNEEKSCAFPEKNQRYPNNYLQSAKLGFICEEAVDLIMESFVHTTDAMGSLYSKRSANAYFGSDTAMKLERAIECLLAAKIKIQKVTT